MLRYREQGGVEEACVHQVNARQQLFIFERAMDLWGDRIVSHWCGSRRDVRDQVRSAIRAQIQLPLNLFGEIGVAVRLQAIAELAAGARLALGLDIGDFLALAEEDPHLTGLPMKLLYIVLEETEIQAAFYAKAALSAQAYANFVISGSAIGDPVRHIPPGFNISAGAGAGLKVGAGYQVVASIGIRSFATLVSRSADAVVDETVRTLIAALNKPRPDKGKWPPSLNVGVFSIDDTAEKRVSFYAWNPDKMAPLGSTSKLMILYAAFQLRDDVRKVATGPGVNGANLRDRLFEAWTSSGVPALRDCAAELAGANQPPFLEDVFELSNLANINFKGNTDPLRPCGLSDLHLDFANHTSYLQLIQDLDRRHQGEHSPSPDRWPMILELDYGPRLWLTSLWSDNAAAYTCAAEIGLPYIYALMKASGLYSETNHGQGMRLLMPAFENVPKTIPAEWSPRAKTLAQRCKASSTYNRVINQLGGKVTKQAGTVRTLCAMMLALAREKLISAAASREMVSFLRPLTFATSAGELGHFGYLQDALSPQLSMYELGIEPEF